MYYKLNYLMCIKIQSLRKIVIKFTGSQYKRRSNLKKINVKRQGGTRFHLDLFFSLCPFLNSFNMSSSVHSFLIVFYKLNTIWSLSDWIIALFLLAKSYKLPPIWNWQCTYIWLLIILLSLEISFKNRF